MKAYTVKRRITLTVEAGSIVMLDERQASRNALSLEEKSESEEETSNDDSEAKTNEEKSESEEETSNDDSETKTNEEKSVREEETSSDDSKTKTKRRAKKED